MGTARFSTLARGALLLALIVICCGCKPKRTIEITIEPEGAGVASIAPEKEVYRKRDALTLTAQPANGYAFECWSGDLASADNPLALTLMKHTRLTATFVAVVPPPGTLVVTIDPADAAAVGAQWRLAAETDWRASATKRR